MIEKPAFSIDELSKIGPLGRSSLYEAIAEGRLIARKNGRRTVILADDFKQFLRSLPPVTAKPSSRA